MYSLILDPAACLITQLLRKHKHIMPILFNRLCWLPVNCWNVFEILQITYKAKITSRHLTMNSLPLIHELVHNYMISSSPIHYMYILPATLTIKKKILSGSPTLQNTFPSKIRNSNWVFVLKYLFNRNLKEKKIPINYVRFFHVLDKEIFPVCVTGSLTRSGSFWIAKIGEAEEEKQRQIQATIKYDCCCSY